MRYNATVRSSEKNIFVNDMMGLKLAISKISDGSYFFALEDVKFITGKGLLGVDARIEGVHVLA